MNGAVRWPPALPLAAGGDRRGNSVNSYGHRAHPAALRRRADAMAIQVEK